MANLKELIVNGVSRFIGKVYIDDSHINIINNVAVTENPKFTDTVDLTQMTGILPVAKGGTGKTTGKDAANYFLNSLDIGVSTPVDADYYISQYVSGGTTTTTYYRRPMSALWTYIKGKTDTLYVPYNLFDPRASYGTAIASNSNLDADCNAVGTYRSDQASTSQSLTGTVPVTSSGFKIFNIGGYGTKQRQQFLVHNSATDIMYRGSTNIGDSSTWSKWYKIVSLPSGSDNKTFSAVGSSTQPVYVNANGQVIACTSYANASVASAKYLITEGDNRSVATSPNDYTTTGGLPNRIAFRGLKNNTYIGSPSSDVYSYLVGLRGWSDSSGGKAHEIAFNDSGIFIRKGGTTTWEDWRTILSVNTGSAVGSTTQPIYIDERGYVQLCTAYENSSVKYAKYLLNRGTSAISIVDSGWNVNKVQTGYTMQEKVWHQAWKQSGLTYTPNGGSATAITDSGNLLLYLSSSSTANDVSLNMAIDGIVYAVGGFVGNGGTMTNHITMTPTSTGGEPIIKYKTLRNAKSYKGSWAYTPVLFLDAEDNYFAQIGVYGTSSTFNYMYLGAGVWNDELNFRIYPNGDVKATNYLGTWGGNTIPVNKGGTGATTFTSGELLIGNGASAIGTRAIKNIIAKNNLGWTSSTGTQIPTLNTLAYWDGRYNATSSNLTYSVKGAFGDASTKGVVTIANGGIPDTGVTDNDIPTTASVVDYVGRIITSAVTFKGTIGTGGNFTTLPSFYKIGWAYRVVSAGTYAGQTCEIGDLIIAVKDSGSSSSNSDWTVIQNNIDGAITESGGTINGVLTVNNSFNADSATIGNLIVNGNASFTSGLTGNLTGNVTGNVSGSAGSVAWSGVIGKPTATQNGKTGISISNHGTGTVIGVQSSTTSVTGVQSTTTTASKVTLGTAFSIPNVTGNSDVTVPKAATSATTVPIKNTSATTIPNVTAVGSGSASLTMTMDTTDTKKLKIAFSHTHTAPTLGTAISIIGVQSSTTSVTGVSGSTTASKVTLGTAFSVPNVTGNSDVTVPIKNTSATTVPIKNTSASTFVTGTTHTITDNGHTHGIS